MESAAAAPGQYHRRVLVLVPTRLEMRRLFPELGEPPERPAAVPWRLRGRTEAVDVAWCGFGLAASGAGAGALLAVRQDSACLAGLAGSLDCDRAPLGSVLVADRVHVAGLGLPREPPTSGRAAVAAELRDDPSLRPPPDPWLPAGIDRFARVGGLLSVAMPSIHRDEAARRGAAHPTCLAEEMEANEKR